MKKGVMEFANFHGEDKDLLIYGSSVLGNGGNSLNRVTSDACGQSGTAYKNPVAMTHDVDKDECFNAINNVYADNYDTTADKYKLST